MKLVPRVSERTWLAVAVFVLTLVALARAAPEIGIPRDEAIYFEASRHQGAYWAKVVRQPGRLFDTKLRDEHFAFNREHPVVMKSAAGISARLFAEAPQAIEGKKPDPWAPEGGLWPLMSERAAMRLPAQALAAFGAALLAFVAFGYARRRGARAPLAASAALLASCAFVGLPRVAFHASLHCFDVPIAVCTLAVVLAYLRALHRPRWAIVTGVALGLSIGVKLNALFLGPLLALHYYGSLLLRRQRGGQVRRGELAPPVLVACLVLAPLVAWLTWPWVWHDTANRVAEYVAFHGRHSYYNMEFLGHNYNRPPMPFAYPWVMTLATVPLTLLMLAVGGVFTADAPQTATPASQTPPEPTTRWGRWLQYATWPETAPRFEGYLFGGLALAFMTLIALPSVPIFGGTKHWLTAMPMLALLAGRSWVALWLRAAPGRRWVLVATPLVLAPCLWATAHGHPYNLSQYSPLIGGARGAAVLGLNRGFWGYAAGPLLDASKIDAKTPVYLHDLHPLAQKQYQREGVWPGWRGRGPERAHGGLIFHEAHMASDEARLVQGVGSAAPVDQLRLDDVPLTSLYRRP